jgi:hypothetical protein
VDLEEQAQAVSTLPIFEAGRILRVSGPAAARLLRREGVPLSGRVRPRIELAALWAWIEERERRFEIRKRHMREVDAAIRGRPVRGCR